MSVPEAPRGIGLVGNVLCEFTTLDGEDPVLGTDALKQMHLAGGPVACRTSWCQDGLDDQDGFSQGMQKHKTDTHSMTSAFRMMCSLCTSKTSVE